MKNYGDLLRPRRITPPFDLHNSSKVTQPHSLIVNYAR